MTDEPLHTAYLGLGSNLGDAEENIHTACRLVAERIGEIKQQSDIYRTEPWGFQSDNAFANAVICIETTMKPHDLLSATQQIERHMGRTEKTSYRNGKACYQDRIIDIDILLYDDLTIDEPDLKIPHPLMQQRDFVMTPLRQLTNGQSTCECRVVCLSEADAK